MFANCYAGKGSPVLEEKQHCNPIYIRLGGRKNPQRRQEGAKDTEASMIQHSIIKGCELSSVNETQREPRNAHLIQSVILPGGFAETSHQQGEKAGKEGQIPLHLNSRKRPLESIDMKYNELQVKYIGALEKTNHYLQKQLERSRAYSQNEGSSHSNKKISSQLLDLKQRLNNIDFTSLKKLAGQGRAKGTPEDKENVPTFKQLRSKLQ